LRRSATPLTRELLAPRSPWRPCRRPLRPRPGVRHRRRCWSSGRPCRSTSTWGPSWCWTSWARV